MNEITTGKLLYLSGLLYFLVISIAICWLQIIAIIKGFNGLAVVIIGCCTMSIPYIIGLWIMSKTRHCWHTGEMNENASR